MSVVVRCKICGDKLAPGAKWHCTRCRIVLARIDRIHNAKLRRSPPKVYRDPRLDLSHCDHD